MQMQNTSRVLELDIGLKQDQGYNSISRPGQPTAEVRSHL